MSGSEYDGASAFGRIARFEDARTDEDAVATQLHHECGIGGGGDATGGEVDDGEAFELADFECQVKADGVLFGEAIDFFFAECAKLCDFAVHGAHVAHGFDDVARACFSLRSNHRGSLLDATASLA